MAGKFVWFDVAAKDTDRVRSFYAELLGWPIGDADAGPYRAWVTDGDQPWAGIVQAEDATAGHWVPYVQVEDLDAATERATALGATVLVDKSEGPAGTAVTIADPGGAVLALWVPR